MKVLSLPSDRDPFIFTCGATQQDLDKVAAARSLATLGISALPAVEGALRQTSDYPDSAGLLLAVYAQLRGAQAVPRLTEWRNEFSQGQLDGAMAVALNITSYVSMRSSAIVPTDAPAYCGGPEPRDSLDLLVLAWIGNSQPLLEASLSPRAKAGLDSQLQHPARAEVAVGYRFDPAPGAWSESRMKLNIEQQQTGAPELDANPQLNTTFMTASGADCGTYRILFLWQSLGSFRAGRYVIDNSDVGEILRLISSCAAQTQ